MTKLITRLQLRRDTSEALNNVVLAQGEPGYATDTFTLKIGDGVHTFADLRECGGQKVDTVTVHYATSASSHTIPAAGWSQDYQQGTKERPWIWTRITYSFVHGDSIQLFTVAFDSSWKEYVFIGTKNDVETTFICEVNHGILSIGTPDDPAGYVRTKGTFTPQGIIEVK